jgi:hypothetical protein
MSMRSSTHHGMDCNGVCIEEVSCELNVLKCRIVVYIWEERVGAALLGAMVVVLFICEGRGILDGNKVKKITRTDDLH